MGKRTNLPRREADFYPTPQAAVVPLIPYLRKTRTFAEPCAGDWDLVRHLESFGLRCVWQGDIRTGKDARGPCHAAAPHASYEGLTLLRSMWMLHCLLNVATAEN
jgi:hypothetical protein